MTYLLPIGLFCAIWWWLPLNCQEGIREIFVDIQAPIYSAISDTNSFILKAKRNLVDKEILLSEYIKLVRMNAYLQVRLDDLSSALQVAQIGGQKPILGPIDSRFNFIYANVVRRDLASWADKLVINKGTHDGVQIGDGVISGNNVVGRIEEVFHELSVVKLLSSPTFRTSACLENDNFPIIFHGSAGSGLTQYSGVAENIVTNLSENRPKASKKIRLVSSYLSDIFPGGITIGYISKIDGVYNGMFTSVPVELDTNFINTLREVAVLSKVGAK